MPDQLLSTPEEVAKWVETTKGDLFGMDESAFQDIVDNVAPELCGYAIALLAAANGH